LVRKGNTFTVPHQRKSYFEDFETFVDDADENRSTPSSSTIPKTRNPSAQYSFPPEARLLTLCNDFNWFLVFSGIKEHAFKKCSFDMF